MRVLAQRSLEQGLACSHGDVRAIDASVMPALRKIGSLRPELWFLFASIDLEDGNVEEAVTKIATADFEQMGAIFDKDIVLEMCRERLSERWPTVAPVLLPRIAERRLSVIEKIASHKVDDILENLETAVAELQALEAAEATEAAGFISRMLRALRKPHDH